MCGKFNYQDITVRRGNCFECVVDYDEFWRALKGIQVVNRQEKGVLVENFENISADRHYFNFKAGVARR